MWTEWKVGVIAGALGLIIYHLSELRKTNDAIRSELGAIRLNLARAMDCTREEAQAKFAAFTSKLG